jgi:hypothetical protein
MVNNENRSTVDEAMGYSAYNFVLPANALLICENGRIWNPALSREAGVSFHFVKSRLCSA